MICPFCQAEITDESEICPKCDMILTGPTEKAIMKINMNDGDISNSFANTLIIFSKIIACLGIVASLILLGRMGGYGIVSILGVLVSTSILYFSLRGMAEIIVLLQQIKDKK